MKASGRRGEYWIALLDLFACLAGYAIAAIVESRWTGSNFFQAPDPWIAPWVLSAIIAWFVSVFPESQWNEGMRLWVDGYLAVIGANLLVQCGLSWVSGMQPASWFVIVAGSALSIAISGLLRKWSPMDPHAVGKGTLLVGFDHHTGSLIDVMHRDKILGGIGNASQAADFGVPFLGESSRLEQACEAQRPASIFFSGMPAGTSFRQLLQLHYAGIEVEGAPFGYERVLQRVAWQYLQPSDLLFFLNPKTSRAMLAFQAVYKNLLGLTLRIIFAPLLILTSLLIIVFTGGPALEHVECLGFRRTPFQMLRFRTLGADGNPTRIGKLITRLHLTNLPQLMNVVRGEMTLFGPPPVRTVFAERLSQLIPAYVYRFTVKPGIFGWLDANLPNAGGLTDEMLRLEYDLYYIRQESPSLDLDILLRMLSRTPDKPQVAAVPDVVGNS